MSMCDFQGSKDRTSQSSDKHHYEGMGMVSSLQPRCHKPWLSQNQTADLKKEKKLISKMK